MPQLLLDLLSKKEKILISVLCKLEKEGNIGNDILSLNKHC